MNKKGQTEEPMKNLMGYVLVFIVLVAFIGFFFKLWGIFLNKPNQATLNSFDNLMHEINTLEADEEKIVPYFIQDGLYLYTDCEVSFNENGIKGSTVLNDVCICQKTCFDKRLQRNVVTWITEGSKQTATIEGRNYITHTDKVANIKITRDPTGLKIYDCRQGC